MKSLICKSILLSFFSLALASCASPDDGGTGAASSSSKAPVSPGAPTATEASPLQLKIFTMYDQTDEVLGHKFVETNTDTCQATNDSPHVTCTVAIPEGRLYHSEMRYSFSWRTDKCKILIFQPYYYAQSVDPGFLPPWADSPIDCSNLPRSPDCYGGAAPGIVKGFPKFTSNIYLRDPTSSAPENIEEKLASAFSKNYASDRRTVNDLDPSKAGTAYTFAAGDKYIANSYVDYTWTCRDDWYDPETYTITLKVKDVDSQTNPQLNNFRTWEEKP